MFAHMCNIVTATRLSKIQMSNKATQIEVKNKNIGACIKPR